MRKKNLILLSIALIALFTSCETENEKETKSDTINITPSVSSIVFEADGSAASPVTFKVVTSKSSWDVLVSQNDWLHVTKDMVKQTFTLTADVNTSVSERTPVVVAVTAGTLTPVNIHVSQKAASAGCNSITCLCGHSIYIDSIDVPNGEKIDKIEARMSLFPAGGTVALASAQYVNNHAELILPESVPDKNLCSYFGMSAEQGAKSNTLLLYVYSNGNYIGEIKLKQWDGGNWKTAYISYLYANKGYNLNSNQADMTFQLSINKGWNVMFMTPADRNNPSTLHSTQMPAGITAMKWRFR
ncbi:MAG: BACON domain-containing protein [Prevotellaceae bacterium]|jgi:hypothetical protein|nr:BACON domain-containing protein [Prevotellaceae bacterium]